MTKGAINFSKNDDYYTPPNLLKQFGKFDYDPATTVEMAAKHGIPHFDTAETDGLKSDWTLYDNIWINPPFTLKKEFLKKAWETFNTANNNIYMLLPISYLTTATFHSLSRGSIIYLPKKRIKFDNSQGETNSPAFGSVVIKLADTWGIRILEDVDV